MDTAEQAAQSSPKRPVVKRTYGRRRRDPALDATVVESTLATSLSSRASSNELPFYEAADEHPPTSDGLDASGSFPVVASGDEHSGEDSNDSDAASTHFEFDWKKRLKEMDEDDNALPSDATYVSGENPTGSEIGSSLQHTGNGSTTFAHPVQLQDLFSTAQTSSALAAQRNASRVPSPVPSPVPRRRQGANRKSMAPLLDSDSESSQVLHQSPLRAVFSHLSSPAAPVFKDKGKRRAIDNGSDGEPAGDEDDDDYQKPRQKRSVAKGKEKRIKAPTKKEREETQKATARMNAQRAVVIAPMQTKHFNVTQLLQKFAQPQVVPIPEEVPAEAPTSDPIQPFSSSPGTHLAEQLPRVSSRARSASLKPFARTPSPVPHANLSFMPTGLLGSAVVKGQTPVDHESSDDEEMPDIESLLDEDGKKRAEQERLQQLAKRKQRALEQQQVRALVGEDDSDLEIVHEDMHAVAREEAQARRASAAHGLKRSSGKHAQLAHAGVARRYSSAVNFHALKAAAAPSFLRKKTRDAEEGQLTRDQLSRTLLRSAQQQAAAVTRQKEENFVRLGGKLKQRATDSALVGDVKSVFAAIIQKRLSEQQSQEGADGDEEEDEDDPDYRPAEENHSEEGTSAEYATRNGENAPVPQDASEPVQESGDDENMAPMPRRRTVLARGQLRTVHSDDENEMPSRSTGRTLAADNPFTIGPSKRPQVTQHRRASTSSLENRTEDGTDKENDVSLMYDRGEDKENTAVVSQSSTARLSFGRTGSFFSQMRGRSPFGLDDGFPMESTPQEERRALQELPTGEDEDDNPFALSSNARGPARRLTFSPTPVKTASRSGGEAHMGDTATSSVSAQPVALKAGFSDFFESDAPNAGHSPAAAVPVQGGGLSAFFSQTSELGGPTQIRGAKTTQDLALTLDVALQPALDVSQTLMRRADNIFEREQKLLAEGAIAPVSPEKRKIFVNAHGFLTQTRPTRTPARNELSSPTQIPSISQITIRDLFSPRPATRKPFAPIVSTIAQFDDDDDLDEQPRIRLKRRRLSISPTKCVASSSRAGSVSPSPRKPRNAFATMMKQATRNQHKLPVLTSKMRKSEFIEGEAHESDDDNVIGFGLQKQDDGDEEDDDESQDQTLPGLVDDAHMDTSTLAEAEVLEKHREQLKEDDAALEKYHMDVVQGKQRTAPRVRGIGFEDDDSDEDDDGVRVRQRMQRQQRKIVGDTLDVIAKNPDTAPFADAYHDHADDDDDEFAHMDQDDATLVASQEMDVDQEDGESQEQQVSSAALLQELRAVARREQSRKSINTHDVSWIDPDQDDYEEENTLPVKEITVLSKTAIPKLRDADWDPSMELKHGCDEGSHDRVRLKDWAKTETRTLGLGRAAGSASAVTGGGAKRKAGSVTRGSANGHAVVHGPKQTNKVTRTTSVLSAVSSSRRAKFQG